MAVYTYFGSMDGLWQALRQEGFTRLAARFATVPTSDDPVRDLTALAAAYVGNALDHPDLYRVMFDASVDLEDLPAADAALEHMVRAAGRARADGRFHPATDPLELATQSWTVAHGVASLVAGGPLPLATLGNGITLLTALFIGTGDDPGRCRRSVETGWRPLPQAGPG